MAIILEAIPSISPYPVVRCDWFSFASLRLRPYKCLCLGIGVLALLLAASSAHAQQQEGSVILESSEQVFSVMAALNAGGYDAGLGHATGDPTREEAREYLEQAHAPVAKRLETFYSEHRVEGLPSHGQDRRHIRRR